jgi:hypothetical protein
MLLSRREFVGVSAGMTLAASGGQGQQPAPQPTQVPKAKIKNVEVSRLLIGGNIFVNAAHSRDLRYVEDLAARYNTEEKVYETLRLAEQHGINTYTMHTPPRYRHMIKRYRNELGGKIQWLLAPSPPTEDIAQYRQMVREWVDLGAEMIYLAGGMAEMLYNAGKWDVIAGAVDAAKECGVPSGVGAHDLRIVMECESRNIEPDFYVKTLHSHNYPSAPRPDEIKGPYQEVPGYWCADPSETIRVMGQVQKPWIAFKVMAAGAIPPKEAFRYAFESGADFVLAGMFDWQVAEDVAVANEVLASVKRERPWYA